MTRYPNKKNNSLIVHGKDEADNEIIKFFKEVCLRDGLEMRKELINLIRERWAPKHNYPLGNPQHQIIEYKEVHEAIVPVCDLCGSVAVYRCETVFPINSTKSLCRSHTCLLERRGEVISKKPVGGKQT